MAPARHVSPLARRRSARLHPARPPRQRFPRSLGGAECTVQRRDGADGATLAEQIALTVFEVPLDRGLGGYQRFWLPSAMAKGGSARRVYLPESLVGDAIAYAEIDRAEVIERARAAGRYRRWRRPLVIEDPDRRSRGVPTVAG